MNAKSFTVYFKNSQAFKLIIDGFHLANSMFMKDRFTIKITTTIAKLKSKETATISIKPVKIIISKFSQKFRNFQAFNSGIYRITSSSRLQIRQTSQTILVNFSDIVTMRLRSRITTQNIKMGAYKILASPILAKFITLSAYDSTTLSTQDTKTLAQLDSTTL